MWHLAVDVRDTTVLCFNDLIHSMENRISWNLIYPIYITDVLWLYFGHVNLGGAGD